MVTNNNKAVVRWANNQAFDRTVTLNQIGGLNLGFPGQYYDQESGLWYNWHRYYDATMGRYTQSDPIGLMGGLNTYGYALGNPVIYFDFMGLAWETIGIDYHGAKNWGIGILNRISSLEEGKFLGNKDFRNTTRDVHQKWVSHPYDPQKQRNFCFASDPIDGDLRVIRQTYGEYTDPWAINGKSWYWSPVVGSPTWD